MSEPERQTLSKALLAIKKGLDDALDDDREDTFRHRVVIASAQLQSQVEMLDMGLHAKDLSDEAIPD